MTDIFQSYQRTSRTQDMDSSCSECIKVTLWFAIYTLPLLITYFRVPSIKGFPKAKKK